jgi:preprotein translocase subunit SecA
LEITLQRHRRPQLVGTTSIVHSEELSSRLNRDSLRLLLQILLLKALWREKFQIKDVERAIPELESLENLLDSLSPAILRNFAQKAGIESISLEKTENQNILADLLNIPEENIPRLQSILGTVSNTAY